jgi:hypothetical protein
MVASFRAEGKREEGRVGFVVDDRLSLLLISWLRDGKASPEAYLSGTTVSSTVMV